MVIVHGQTVHFLSIPPYLALIYCRPIFSLIVIFQRKSLWLVPCMIWLELALSMYNVTVRVGVVINMHYYQGYRDLGLKTAHSALHNTVWPNHNYMEIFSRH